MTSSELFVVVAASVLMSIGAFVDGWKFKVPNRLTFGIILAGWLYWGVSSGLVGLGSSVAGTLAAGALLLPIWMIGATGGGDVKLYAGFGAWVVPLSWFGYENLVWAFAISIVLGGVMALVMVWWDRSLFTNLENIREIRNDWRNSTTVEEIRAKAKACKPQLKLLPYGVPLTIGSLAYMMYVLPAAIGPLMSVATSAGIQ